MAPRSSGSMAIVDYGINNLRSVFNALTRLGYEAQVTPDPENVALASGIVLPGVGSFDRAMRALRNTGLQAALREAVDDGVPLLGICLGMQLLFEGSDESLEAGDGPGEPGLGLLPGRMVRFDATQKVPHMGWNQLEPVSDSFLLEGIPAGSYMYFVHSYYLATATDPGARPPWDVAHTSYGSTFVSVVQRGSIMGTQFHPEKSAPWGLRLLDNFGRFVRQSLR